MTAVEFIRSIIFNKPWEPKQSTLNRLTHGFLEVNKKGNENFEEAKKELAQTIKELQWRGELKILAGLGWATGEVEFIFQASRY